MGLPPVAGCSAPEVPDAPNDGERIPEQPHGEVTISQWNPETNRYEPCETPKTVAIAAAVGQALVKDMSVFVAGEEAYPVKLYANNATKEGGVTYAVGSTNILHTQDGTAVASLRIEAPKQQLSDSFISHETAGMFLKRIVALEDELKKARDNEDYWNAEAVKTSGKWADDHRKLTEELEASRSSGRLLSVLQQRDDALVELDKLREEKAAASTALDELTTKVALVVEQRDAERTFADSLRARCSHKHDKIVFLREQLQAARVTVERHEIAAANHRDQINLAHASRLAEALNDAAASKRVVNEHITTINELAMKNAALSLKLAKVNAALQ